jgi:hypothetical protein
MYLGYVLLDYEMYLEIHNEISGSFLSEVCEVIKFKEIVCLPEVKKLFTKKSTC